MSMSKYESDLYLNSRFRDGGAMPALGTIYIALANADLTRLNVTANELPIGTGGYARIAVGTTNADWAAMVDSAGLSMITNSGTLSGGTASANLNGGANIGFYGIYDAATAGNLIRFGAFGTPKAILSGDAITIPPGGIQILN
jgi:hypothetical protein